LKKNIPLLLILITGLLTAKTEIPVKTFNFSYLKVLGTTQQILKEINIPMKLTNNGVITTETIVTDITTINDYIREDKPVDRPGWEKGRFYLTLNFNRLNPNQTELTIEAKFERFGVPSELLLIPPAWTPVASNGVLEDIIFSAISDKLSLNKNHSPKKVMRHSNDVIGDNMILPYFHPDPPFIPNVPVSNDPGAGNQNETTIGIFGGYFVCGGWNDNRTGIYHVGFASSTDGGLTWSDDTVLTEPTYSEDGDPVICIDDSGTVYYFWLSFERSTNRGDIFLTKSYDGGSSWGPFVCVTPNSLNSLDDKPWATIDGNNVYVSWYEYGTTGNLKFTRSTDRGATWSTGVAVGSGGNGTTPFRGTDSTIYVGWGFQDLKLNKSTDMGRTWQGQRTIIPVTWNPGSTPYRINNIPCFKTSNDRTKLYVVFADSRLRSGQLDVFFSHSTDEGQTWSTPVKVNDTPAQDTTKQFYPWMAVDPYDRIHVVWHDTRAGSRIGQYYAYSTDFGQTWSQNYRASDTAAYANTFIGDYTACAADSHFVYALWCDARTAQGNPDIFFTKGMHQQNRDVGVQSIVSPGRRIPSMVPVDVEAIFRNFGLNQETFPATSLIIFDDSIVFIKDTTLTLNPAQEDTVLFGEFTSESNLLYDVVFYTALVGDENPSNDTLVSTARTTPDAGVSKIIKPRGRLIPGIPADAEAMIKNFSGDPKDVPATLFVQDTITGRVMLLKDTTVSLGSGESLAVVFGQFLPIADSFYRTVCYTTLTGDDDPTNDTAKANSFARIGSLPDSFGYVYESTQEGDTVTFFWIDTIGGTRLSGWSPDADDGYVTRVLPFTFPYYTSNLTQINICTNGFLQWSTTSTAYLNASLPYPSIQNLMAIFWDDLNLETQGAVYEKTGTDPSYIAYSWVDVPRYGTSEFQTFQVVLYENSKIYFNYLDVNGTLNSNTIGIQGGTGANGYYLQYAPPHIVEDSTTVLFYSTRVGIYEAARNNLPSATVLYSAWPNPMVKRNAKISFSLAKKGLVSLNIYDVTGRLTRNLVNAPYEAGNYKVTWDGKNDRGQHVMSGIYFYTIKTTDYKSTKKLVLMR
jgi:hypothetical protein